MDAKHDSEIRHNERFFFKQLEVFNKYKYGYTNRYKLYRICIPFGAIIFSLIYYFKVRAQSALLTSEIENVNKNPRLISMCISLNLVVHKYCNIEVLSGVMNVSDELSSVVDDTAVISNMVTQLITDKYERAMVTLSQSGVGEHICMDTCQTYEDAVYSIRLEPIDMYDYVSNYRLIAPNIIMTVLIVSLLTMSVFAYL